MLMRTIEIDDISEDDIISGIKFCRKYLPKQGPLEYFVHHNTLHAFEEFDFYDGLTYASEFFNCKTHKSLYWYQDQLSKDRIKKNDLLEIAKKHLPFLDEQIILKILHWDISSNEKSTNLLRDKVLASMPIDPPSQSSPLHFKRVNTFWDNISDNEIYSKIKNRDQECKINFFSAYFDKGNSYWEMENKDRGLLYCFYDFVKFLPKTHYNKRLKDIVLSGSEYESKSDFIVSLANTIGIPADEFNSVLFQMLYRLKGWTALSFSLEENVNYNPTGINIDIEEYLLIFMIFESCSFKYFEDKNIIRDFEYSFKKPKNHYSSLHNYIFDVLNESFADKKELIDFYQTNEENIFGIDQSLLFRIWHDSYELDLIHRVVSSYSVTHNTKNDITVPSLQVITCIDDREESTRRHFEEYSDSIKTYGYAGHFGLNIQYKSIRDTHFRSLCPLSASADFYIWEEVKGHGLPKTKLLAKAKHFLFHNSKLPISGLFLTFLLGPFVLMLFIFESFFPEKIHKIRRKFKQLMFPKVDTELNYLSSPNRELRGYSVDEGTQIFFKMLKTLGMTSDFAELVFICGHGSKSMNNPHGAAYNCGACAGEKGAANARLMALLGNRSDVRENLKELGVIIPESTKFVGGYHCTSSDKIIFFDKQYLETEQIEYLTKAFKYVEKRDAKERLRKFNDVSLKCTATEALLAASNRAYDFSQPRPEYGHNTNAFCIVGKRENSKKLFLDRRAFLVGYDESEDDPNFNNLLWLLGAVVPVCAGINLEYYFSFVDRDKFGAGVKQGHNVTSLMGVMNGAKSDLRLGLPWQMVEIHEPSRIIFIVEASSKTILDLMTRNDDLSKLIGNEWVKTLLVDANGEFVIYEDKNFVPFKAKVSQVEIQRLTRSDSFSCYTGKRDLLDFYIKD